MERPAKLTIEDLAVVRGFTFYLNNYTDKKGLEPRNIICFKTLR